MGSCLLPPRLLFLIAVIEISVQSLPTPLLFKNSQSSIAKANCTTDSGASSGQCPIVSCNFEQGNCGWLHVSPNSQWTNSYDQKAPDGLFVLTTRFKNDSSAVAQTGCLTLKNATELSFWYHTSSHNATRLRLLAGDLNGTEPHHVLWESKDDNKVFEWSQQTVEIPARTSFKLFLEATTENEEAQSASLDSLSLKNEADLLISCDEPIPEPSTAIPNPTTDPTASSNSPPVLEPTCYSYSGSGSVQCTVSCDFEQGNCGWLHASPNSEWTNSYDQKAPNGLFVLTTRFKNDSPAVARTGCLTLKNATELSFWYHTSSHNATRLRLLAGDLNGTEPHHVLWESNDDDKVSEWSQQTVEIPARTSFKLFLEATTENEETQSASLDSLSLKNEADLLISCDEPIPEPSTAIPNPTTDPTASSNYSLIAEATCNFDFGICSGFTQKGNYVWKAQITANETDVPPQAGAGYIYVNNEQVQSNAGLYAELRTTLTSFLSDYESSGTVEFWYWAGLGTTQFELRYQETDLNLPSTIWQITHDVQDITSERWRKGEATFCNPKKQFTPLAFRVTPGPGFRLAGLDELVSYFHTEVEPECVASTSIETSITCGFELGLCRWFNVENDQINWRRVLGTEGSDGGRGLFYMATEANSQISSSSAARLVSSKFIVASSSLPKRLSFRYRISSINSHLRLSIKSPDALDIEVWRDETVNSQWIEANIVLCDMTNKQLVFSSNGLGVALDDILVKEAINDVICPSIAPVTCDFERGFCGWTTNLDTDFRFKQSLTSVNGLMGDTVMASEGVGFIYATANDRFSDADVPVVLRTIKVLKLRSATKFSFWYHARRYGVRYLKLTMLFTDQSESKEIWAQESGNEQEWQEAQVTLCSRREFMLVFTASFSFPDHVVALDNFILENETKVAGALPPNDFICPGDKIETISCDFEDFGYCGWRMGEWNFDWELVNVSTPDTTSTHTHTISNTTNGAVFLAAAANNRPNGQSVSIFSKAVTTSMPKNTLLEFWYNMKGSGIDYLRVLVQENGVRRIVWERNGDQGLLWTKASLTICTSVGSQLVFEVDFSLPDHTVGLDDIIYHGEINQNDARPGQCPIVSCNFEKGNCGWLYVAPNFAWTNSFNEKAPDGLFVLTTWFNGGYPARASTGCLTLKRETEMSFWYSISSQDTSKLRILAGDFNGTEPYQVLWESDRDDTAFEWSLQTVDIPALTSFQLLLEAVSVDGRPHSASLDSLSLKNEAELLISCDEPIPEPTTATPNPTANPTGNLSCGFENDNPCGWNVYGSEFWHLGQGMIGTKPYGLDGTPFGAGFVYVDSTSLPQTSQPAELESRFGPPMNSELTFNYRAYGFGVVSVILLAETEEGVRYILWSSHSVSQEWTSATARICIKDWHTLIFEARFLATGFVVALDNIVLNSETTGVNLATSNCPPLKPYIPVSPPTQPTTVQSTIRPTSTSVTSVTSVTTVTSTPTPIILPVSWQGRFSCGFEQASLCSWRNLDLSTETELFWRPIRTIPDAYQLTAVEGSYVALAASESWSNNYIARLISPTVNYTAGQNETIRFQLYYRASGRGNTGLNVYAINSDYMPSKPLWSTGMGALNRWNLAVIEIPSPFTTRRQIVLETRFIQRDSWLAIDEIQLEGDEVQIVTEKPTQVPETSTLSCSFDRTFCSWQTLGFSLFYPNEGGTSPSSRNFAFVTPESSSLQSTMTSPLVALQDRTQMSFQYLVSKTLDTFTVYAYINGERTQLWQLVATQQVPIGKWLPARINLCLTGRFRLVFEVKFKSAGATFDHIFGLDELIINNELTVITTAISTFVCIPPPSSTTTITCDSRTAPVEPESTSTSSFCGWKPTVSTGTSVAVGTLNGLIEQGHNGGSFLYVRPLIPVKRADQASVAVIESSEIPANSSVGLFTFWYQQQGAKVTLTTRLVSNGQLSTLLTLEGSTTNWTPVSYTLSFQSTAYKLLFRVEFIGTPSSQVGQYFALDDIWYSSEDGFTVSPQIDTIPVPTVTPTAPATTTKAATERPPPPRPTTSLEYRRGEQEKAIIGVGTVSGILVFVAAVILVYHFCTKGKTETTNQKQPEQTHNQTTELTTRPAAKRDSTVPPAKRPEDPIVGVKFTASTSRD